LFAMTGERSGDPVLKLIIKLESVSIQEDYAKIPESRSTVDQASDCPTLQKGGTFTTDCVRLRRREMGAGGGLANGNG